MIAKNIAHRAVLAGHSALFITAADLLLDSGKQESARALDRRLRYYAGITLLVIDEVGFLAFDNRNADLLFQSDVCQRLSCAGFLGPLWQAEDDVAQTVVTTILKEGLEFDAPVAECLRDLRAERWDEADTYLPMCSTVTLRLASRPTKPGNRVR